MRWSRQSFFCYPFRFILSTWVCEVSHTVHLFTQHLPRAIILVLACAPEGGMLRVLWIRFQKWSTGKGFTSKQIQILFADSATVGRWSPPSAVKLCTCNISLTVGIAYTNIKNVRPCQPARDCSFEKKFNDVVQAQSRYYRRYSGCDLVTGKRRGTVLLDDTQDYSE